MKKVKFNRWQWITASFICVVFVVAAIYYFKSYKGSDSYNVTFDALQSEVTDDGLRYVFAGISLPEGKYKMTVTYMSNSEASFEAQIDNNVYYTTTLSPTYAEAVSISDEFELIQPTDKCRLTFVSNEADPISLVQINFRNIEGKSIFKDGLIWGWCALIAAVFSFIAVYLFDKSTHKIALLGTILATLAMIAPIVLARGGIMGIDSKAHMMRIEGIYMGLLDHQFPVVLYPQYNNGYGQIGVLYPDLFLYIPALFRVLGMSQYGTLKLFMFLLCIASGVISYVSAKSIFKHNWQILLTTLICIFGEMNLRDFYYAGKFGGSYLADMMWPFMIVGLYSLFYGDKKKWYLISLGLAAVFCSHVTSATVGCIVVVLFAALNIKKLADKNMWTHILKAMGLFFLLIIGNASTFLKFYFSDWGQGTLQWTDFYAECWGINTPHVTDLRWDWILALLLIMIVLMVLCGVRGDKLARDKEFILHFVIISGIMFWLSTRYFPWQYLTRIPAIKYYTNMLQSGFRFLPIAGVMLSYALSAILEICVKHIENRRWFKTIRTVITMCVILLVLGYNYMHESLQFISPEMKVLYYDEVIGEVETNMEDYLPEGTKTEWYSSDAGYISDEEVAAYDFSRVGSHIRFTYDNNKDGAYVEFPKFYYDGYNATNDEGESLRLEKGDKNRVRVYLEETDSNIAKVINLKYSVSLLLTILMIISVVAWIAVIFVLVRKNILLCDIDLSKCSLISKAKSKERHE